MPFHQHFINYTLCSKSYIILADKSRVPSLGKGTVHFTLDDKQIILHDILHVPQLWNPLLLFSAFIVFRAVALLRTTLEVSSCSQLLIFLSMTLQIASSLVNHLLPMLQLLLIVAWLVPPHWLVTIQGLGHLVDQYSRLRGNNILQISLQKVFHLPLHLPLLLVLLHQIFYHWLQSRRMLLIQPQCHHHARFPPLTQLLLNHRMTLIHQVISLPRKLKSLLWKLHSIYNNMGELLRNFSMLCNLKTHPLRLLPLLLWVIQPCHPLIKCPILLLTILFLPSNNCPGIWVFGHWKIGTFSTMFANLHSHWHNHQKFHWN